MSENLGAKFSIDINSLQAGLNSANKLIRESQSEFKAAAASMDDWTKSEAGLTARNEMLNRNIEVQQTKVSALKASYQRLVDEGLDETSDRAVYLRTQINNEEAALNKNKAEVDRNTRAISELGDETQDTGEKVEKAGGKFEKFGEMAKAAAKVAAAAVGAMAAGVVALTKQSVEAYADYEQLVGGVETLFGTGGKGLEEYAKSVGKTVDEARGEFEKLESAQDTVLNNASKAFETAGLSANEYMETVTSFSASLIQSTSQVVNEDVQAEISDIWKEIVQVSESGAKGSKSRVKALENEIKDLQKHLYDTVKTGESIQKAAELADQAIIDMSDNANKMGSDMASIQNAYNGFAKGNYTMLDNLKLGYGGTKEEMERLLKDAQKISGIKYDLSSFADITEAIHVIQTEMGITGTTAKEAASTISGSLGMMKSAWTNVITGMADENADFEGLVKNLVDSISTVAENLVPRIKVALDGVVELVKQLVPLIPPLVQEILPDLLQSVSDLIQGVVEILPDLLNTVMDLALNTLLPALLNMLPELITATMQIITDLIVAIANALPTIVEAIMQVLPQIIESLINAIPQLLEAAITLLMAIVEAIPTIITELVKALPEIVTKTVTTLINNLPVLVKGAIQLFTGIVQAIPKIIPALIKAIPTIIKAIVNALTSSESLQAIAQAGSDLIKGLWNGIKDMASWIGEKIKGFGEGILDGLKSFFGIHSPSTVMENMIGKNLALGIGKGFEENIGKVNDEIKSSIAPVIDINAQGGFGGNNRSVVINQTNNYSQAHSRYELYKSKQQTAAAVRLAMGRA